MATHQPLTLVYQPLDALTPYARNSRTHDAAQVAKLASSMREFGFTAPVLIRAGTILAGHGRLMAARQLGLDQVPTVSLDHLTDEQARAYVIADNRLAEDAGWDDNLLALELRDLVAAGYDAGFTGFDAKEIDQLLAGLDATPKGQADADDVPEARPEAITVPGDIWQLGNHRIICGDSLKRDTYAALMAGARADLLVTDPPYGVAYHANKKGNRGASIEGDLTQAAIPVSFALCLENLGPDAPVYLFGGSANVPMYGALFDHHLRMQPRHIVWVKESFVLRPNAYHSQFEIVFFGWKGKGGSKEAWYGDRKASDVWQIRRDLQKDREHPTQKPAAVYVIPITNSCPPGGIVLEPFSGSGVAIIAAEQTGRKCYAIELSPHYCDVAVRRWQNFTGRKATHAITGAAFPG